MDWKLFLTTFALVFLAELGDKTQLASMAASAGTKSPVSVFAGAASALVMSTLIAVIVGTYLQKYIPQHLVKGGAAILFLVFGVILLINAFQIRKQPVLAPQTIPHTILARAAFKAAIAFEQGSAEDYRILAAKANTTELKALFNHLEQEELEHIAKLSSVPQTGHKEAIALEAAAPDSTTRAALSQDSSEALATALQHEKSTASFYRALSNSAAVTSLKQVFALLAAEEDSHVKHLEDFIARGNTDISEQHA